MATPLLLFLGVPVGTAVGTDLVMATAVKAAGLTIHGLARTPKLRPALLLALGSLPGAALASQVMARGSLSPSLLEHMVGAAVLASGAAVVMNLAGGLGKGFRLPLWALPLLGAVVGVVVTFTSVGAGALVLPLLLATGLEPKEAVGTDILHGLLLAAAASLGHAWGGRVDSALAGYLLAGALPGVVAGARLATRAPQHPLRVALGLVLVVVGARLI